jgi:cbb3-type cytochrome oxidase subunit 3
MAGHVPWGEAFLAMFAMIIVLIFVLIYYCVMPALTAMKRRKQQEEEAWERDPRWNGDTFKYMPKVPEDLLSDKKYSRLAACSRTSSMRSENAPKPPNYSDLFDGTAAVNIPSSSPPSYTSKTPSVELSSSNETVNKDNNKVLQVTDQVVTVKKERVRIIKPKKNKKKIDEAKETLVVKDDDVETVVKEENEKTDQA